MFVFNGNNKGRCPNDASKTVLLFLSAAIVATLTGCAGQPAEESSPAAPPPQPESLSQQPEKAYTYYECVEPLKGLQP